MIDLTLLTPLNSEQRDNLLTAKKCADSLLLIINDILDFSKIEAGKMKIDATPLQKRLPLEQPPKLVSRERRVL